MSLKLKIRTQFPALVTAASPLTLIKTGLSYAFGFDIAALRASLDPIYLVGTITNLILSGATSGTITVKAPAVAGSNIITIPAVTDTLVGQSSILSPSNGIGYSTGAGGAVTQLTSRTTGVTLNKASGAITLFAAAGSATPASFTVTNSLVAATDTVVVSGKSGTNTYLAYVTAVAAGSFVITFSATVGTASDSPVFNFALIKAVSA